MGLVFVITYVSLPQALHPQQSLTPFETVLLYYQHRGRGYVREPFPIHGSKCVLRLKAKLRSTSRESAWRSAQLTANKQVFMAGTNSRAATVAMSTIPLVLSVCTSLNALAAASRQIWSLARDQALPFSSWFRKVGLVGSA